MDRLRIWMDSLRLNSHRRGCGRLRRFGVLRVFWQPLPYQRHQGSFGVLAVETGHEALAWRGRQHLASSPVEGAEASL